MDFNSRYTGKPLVRLLECYVLWAIDMLPNEESSSLANMTPKLQKLFQSDGSWQEIIADTALINADAPDHLRFLWKRNLQIARQKGCALTPQQFAEMVVDNNFIVSN